jgi:nucleolar protein 9
MDQILQYLKNSEKVLKANQFSDDEGIFINRIFIFNEFLFQEYQLFMQNVFTELDGYEYRLACSHDGSSLLEIFLLSATSFQLAVFFDRLTGKYESMAGHRYASHVLETIFEAAGKSLIAGNNGLKDSSVEEQGLLPLDALIQRAYDELKSSVISAIHDSYGSHVWRSLLKLFNSLPEIFDKCTADLASSLLEMDEGEGQGFRDLAMNQQTAPFLQQLLQVLVKHPDPSHFHAILTKMLHGFDLESPQSEIPPKSKIFWKRLMEDDIGSHTAQAIIDLLNPGQIQSLYSNLIRGQTVGFLEHPRANYPLQHLVSACSNIGQFNIILEEVTPFLSELIPRRRFGIMVKFAEWAVQHQAAYEQVLSSAFKAFHLEKNNEDRVLLFTAALRLQVKSFVDSSAPLNPQGCSLLCQFARFPESQAKSLIDGLLRLSEKEIIDLSRHSAGSRVIEAFLVGGAMSPKAMQRMGRHFKGHLAHIAMDKYGSHVVEKLWKLSPLPAKNIMMEELAESKEKLESSPHGRLVVRNCRLDQFIRKREDWVKEEQTQTTKRSLFDDIING